MLVYIWCVLRLPYQAQSSRALSQCVVRGDSHKGVITAADLGSALPVLCREPRKAPVMFCILSAGLGFVQLSKF